MDFFWAEVGGSEKLENWILDFPKPRLNFGGLKIPIFTSYYITSWTPTHPLSIEMP